MLVGVHLRVEFRKISGGAVNASTSGVAELRNRAHRSPSVFSGRQQVVESFEVQGYRAVAVIAYCAVVADDLPSGMKKGEVLNLSGRSEFEFLDGTISRITDIS
jgi:hypothetical protein